MQRPTATEHRAGAGAGASGTVIVVEDDPHISDLVAMYLRSADFDVVQLPDGEGALEAVTRFGARAVIVDVGLPGGMDGFEVCRRLRAHGEVPVVMLTARDDEIDRVLGLELGADDYVTKPFSPRELVARVRAILRRDGVSGRAPTVRRVGDLVIDEGRREVRGPDGAPVELTVREFDLLVALAANRGLVLSRRQLLDQAWGADWYGDERTVDVHVRQLRKKLGGALHLQTVRGVGYRLD